MILEGKARRRSSLFRSKLYLPLMCRRGCNSHATAAQTSIPGQHRFRLEDQGKNGTEKKNSAPAFVSQGGIESVTAGEGRLLGVSRFPALSKASFGHLLLVLGADGFAFVRRKFAVLVLVVLLGDFLAKSLLFLSQGRTAAFWLLVAIGGAGGEGHGAAQAKGQNHCTNHIEPFSI